MTLNTLLKTSFHDSSECLNLFPLGMHYAITSRFADDVNEASCIPVRVSRLVKQISASQLKEGGKNEGGTKYDIKAFQVS